MFSVGKYLSRMGLSARGDSFLYDVGLVSRSFGVLGDAEYEAVCTSFAGAVPPFVGYQTPAMSGTGPSIILDLT